jgi:5'(3')-deoxyribonucleotidase
MKKIVYVDMDDTIADFAGHPHFMGEAPNELSVSKMYEPGFFLSLGVIPGAHEGVRALIRMGFDVQILTQPVAESPHSYLEKAQWIGKHFPDLIFKIHMTQDKGQFTGDFLVDDNEKKWKEKFEKSGGKFIWFNHKEPNYWEKVIDQLRGLA